MSEDVPGADDVADEVPGAEAGGPGGGAEPGSHGPPGDPDAEMIWRAGGGAEPDDDPPIREKTFSS